MPPILDAIYTIVEQTQANMYFVLIVLGIMWAIFILTVITRYRLLLLGIHPRKVYGLLGILCSPFLHVNFNHIFFNSIPLFILSDFMLLGGVAFYLNATIYLILVSGFLTWLFARPLIHVGASGVITSYWSFLMINAYEQGGAMSYILGFVCIYYFAGIFFGIFPSKKGVSWEGHLFGLIAGVLLFYIYPYLPQLFSSFM